VSNAIGTMTKTSTPITRLRGLGFCLPGPEVPLAPFAGKCTGSRSLNDLGQEFTYVADVDSTELAITAAEAALKQAGCVPLDIGLVITAPTLLTPHGLDIPAVAVRARMGLKRAETLNLSQGCIGVFAALRLARLFLNDAQSKGDVLIVSACRATTLVDNFNHGGFYWGDGAVAMVVTNEPGSGLHFMAYAESSAEEHYGAMRIPYGDARSYSAVDSAEDLRIRVDFHDQRAQADYITGEQTRCAAVIDSLLDSHNLTEDDVSAIFFPSVGRKRPRMLLSGHAGLRDKVASDFRYAHMGGVDVFLFLHHAIENNPKDAWYLALSPAFTAQWGGVLMRNMTSD